LYENDLQNSMVELDMADERNFVNTVTPRSEHGTFIRKNKETK